MKSPLDAKPAARPKARFVVQKGWHIEVLPLTMGRARIVHTDGQVVDTFW